MKNITKITSTIFITALFSFLISTGFTWSTVNGISICTTSPSQGLPRLVSDSTGGVMVVWANGTPSDIAAQRMDSNGMILWSLNGVAICTANNIQGGQQIISDGAGGSIMAWADIRNSVYDIYAQRTNSSGSTLWTINGITISTTTSNQIVQTALQLISDGANGAIITWYRFNQLGPDYGDIYAQRVNGNGSTLWASNGIAICTVSNSQDFPQIASDGTGGAIIAWEDSRSGSNYDIYAQHVNSAGAPLWVLNGIPICTTINIKNTPRIITDGSGGGIITWVDSRNDGGSTTNSDIYSQRVNSAGSTLWTLNGIPVCIASNNQNNLRVASSGTGDLFITWNDYRNTTANPGQGSDIYVQKINSAGSPVWALNGVAVCTAVNNQIVSGNVLALSNIIHDEFGGAIVTWEDQRGSTTSSDIYAGRIDNSGVAIWTTDGVPVCTDTSNQSICQLISDGSGGAIIAWQDNRGGGTSHIYAQRVYSNGAIISPVFVPEQVWQLFSD